MALISYFTYEREKKLLNDEHGSEDNNDHCYLTCSLTEMKKGKRMYVSMNCFNRREEFSSTNDR